MFKLGSILAALFALIVLAMACDEACSYVDTKGKLCYYKCTKAGGKAASEHREEFFEALKEINTSCKTQSGNRISCKNTPEFGECEQHLWNFGKDC
jgi:hypothetical protein